MRYERQGLETLGSSSLQSRFMSMQYFSTWLRKLLNGAKNMWDGFGFVRQRMRNPTAGDLSKARHRLLSNHDLVTGVGAADMAEVRMEMAKAAGDESLFQDSSVFRGVSLESVLGPQNDGEDDDDGNEQKEGGSGKKADAGDNTEELTPEKPDKANHWDREVAISKAKRVLEDDVDGTEKTVQAALQKVREVDTDVKRQQPALRTRLEEELTILDARARFLESCLDSSHTEFQAEQHKQPTSI
eukprot:6491803-Amphidinium_carterae.4